MEPGWELQSAEVIKSHLGSKKVFTPFLELSKPGLYFVLQFIFLAPVLLYQSLWIFSVKTQAYYYTYNDQRYIVNPEHLGTVIYQYDAAGKRYSATTTRNGLSLFENTVQIRYLPFYPAHSRPDTFEANWLGFLIAYGLYFTFTTMVFFIPNDTMPRNSFFYFTRKKPFIHMIVK